MELCSHYLRNLPLKRLASFAVVFAVLACSIAWIWNATHPLRINVSRDEYEAARARWRAQGVEEYEITIYADAFIDGGSRTIRVGNHGESLISIDPPLNSPDDPRAIAYTRSDTVEGMFEDIHTGLDNRIRSYPGYYRRVSPDLTFDVKFHPQMGYPVEFSGYCRTNWLCACPTDVSWRRVVTSLKILKQTNQVAP